MNTTTNAETPTNIHLANDHSGEPIRLPVKSLRRHVLIEGLAALERSEIVHEICTGLAELGSGALVVDASGDVTGADRFAERVRAIGRLDDLVIVDLAGGGNAYNPFAYASVSSMTDLLIGPGDGNLDTGIWHNRCRALTSSLLEYLVWHRDHRGMRIDAPMIRNSLNLRILVDFAFGPNPEGVPDDLRGGLRSYLQSIPGFKVEKGSQQSQTTLDQHGYLDMQVTKILGAWCPEVTGAESDDIDVRTLRKDGRIVYVVGRAETDEAMLLHLVNSLVAANLYRKPDVLAAQVPFPIGIVDLDVANALLASARSIGFSIIQSAKDASAARPGAGTLFGTWIFGRYAATAAIDPTRGNRLRLLSDDEFVVFEGLRYDEGKVGEAKAATERYMPIRPQPQYAEDVLEANGSSGTSANRRELEGFLSDLDETGVVTGTNEDTQGSALRHVAAASPTIDLATGRID